MVDYRVQNGVAILEVNNPPVNALSTKVRKGLRDGLNKANGDSSVSSILLYGKEKFLAGADIREFATGESLNEPHLVQVTDLLEGSKKPVVAAIQGFCLGGGLEVAISSHWRVADAGARFGFPEVDIGILPGATGTQRFPRLVGLKASLDLIPSGRRIGSKEALAIGAIDKVLDGNFLEGAIKYAVDAGRKSLDGRLTSKRPIKDAHLAQQLAEAATKTAQLKKRGMMAPLFCIKSVLASTLYPYAQGLEKEREYSFTLGTSYQSAALQHSFFAQRSSPKWAIPGGPSFQTVKPQAIKSGAIIGAGTMGTGIAMTMLNVGIPTVLVEQDKEFLDKGVEQLKQLYMGSVQLGRMTEKQAKACMGLLKPSTKLEDVAKVDMVIEAVYENMELKKEIFAKMDKMCRPDTLLCSNTSSLNIDEIASATKRPDKVMGVHFFAPAYHMRLLENIRGDKTSPQTIATCMEFGKRIGKVSILCGNCDGFVNNRNFGPYVTEAVFCVEEGALPHEVDQVMEDFGIPLGPLKVADLSGLDIGWRIRQHHAKKAGKKIDLTASFMSGQRYCALGDMLCEEGRFGRKTGQGFYRYEKAHAKVAYPDDHVTNLIHKYCEAKGITRRRIGSQEIHERCIFSLINEGFKILEEGIAFKPEDIDTAAMLGRGWPAYTGGPMYYAQQVGLQKIYERVCYYYERYPYSMHWQPSKLLERLATNDVPMRQWAKYIPAKL